MKKIFTSLISLLVFCINASAVSISFSDGVLTLNFDANTDVPMITISPNASEWWDGVEINSEIRDNWNSISGANITKVVIVGTPTVNEADTYKNVLNQIGEKMRNEQNGYTLDMSQAGGFSYDNAKDGKPYAWKIILPQGADLENDYTQSNWNDSNKLRYVCSLSSNGKTANVVGVSCNNTSNIKNAIEAGEYPFNGDITKINLVNQATGTVNTNFTEDDKRTIKEFNDQHDQSSYDPENKVLTVCKKDFEGEGLEHTGQKSLSELIAELCNGETPTKIVLPDGTWEDGVLTSDKEGPKFAELKEYILEPQGDNNEPLFPIDRSEQTLGKYVTVITEGDIIITQVSTAADELGAQLMNLTEKEKKALEDAAYLKLVGTYSVDDMRALEGKAADITTLDLTGFTCSTANAPLPTNGGNWNAEVQTLLLPTSASFTRIPDAFATGFTALNEVIIPDNVTVLGSDAFSYCTNLTDINLPTTLVTIEHEALRGTGITEVNLSGLTALTTIEYEAFMGTPITSVTIPENNALISVGNDIFTECNSLEELDLSNLTGITEFGVYNGYTGIVYNCTALKSIIYPPYIETIDASHFNGCTSLETISFGPGLKEIKDGSFNNGTETSLKNIIFRTELDEELGIQTSQLTTIGKLAFGGTCIIESIDLSMCHKLTEIKSTAFENITTLTDVRICTHPKTIREEAFDNCSNIKRVEVVYCAGTDVTQCVCENDAFDYRVTNHQTAQAGAVEECAKLIFTDNTASNAAMNKNCSYNVYGEYNDDGTPKTATYESVFDYFVGNYKTGSPINQANLNDLYKDHQPVAAGNGWWEFLNAGSPIVIDEDGKFLRTYSRTEGSGAVILPDGIKAYRVLNYKADGKDSSTGFNIRGTFVLRELKTTIDNKEVSYVPERTGVVLISDVQAENALLVLKPFVGDSTLVKKYPNTGSKYYDPNGTHSDKDKYEDANLLVGSYGGNPMVASVDSWDHETGTYDRNHINYRNFALTIYNNKYMWQRLRPGGLRSNRAMAQIPSFLFNNNNESKDNSPELFGDNDVVNPFDSASEECIGMVFEGETTGIMVVTRTNEGDGKWYNLQGMEVSQPTKGIFIHNNKKVVIK